MAHVDRRISWQCFPLRRRTLIIATRAVICLVLLAVAPARSDQWPWRSAPTPFCLNIKVIAYDRGPVGKLWQVETEAQRSDGTTVVVETTYYPHMPSRAFRTIKLPDGTRISLVDAIASKSTCRPKRQEVAPAQETSLIRRKPPDCLSPTDKLLGQTVLLGQAVDLVKTWDRGSGGQEWLAPTLGCKELQWQTATLQPDGSRRIEAEGKLVYFALGEPDARLFNPGTSYAEVKPSELLRREMKGAGVPWSPELAKESTREDQNYAATCQIGASPLQ